MTGDSESLAHNRHLVEDLSSAIRDGAAGLGDVPGLLERVIDEGAWREFTTSLGKRVKHERFREFIEAKGLDGLGADEHLVMRLVAGREHEKVARRVAALLDAEAPLAGPGGAREPRQDDDVILPPRQGNDQSYLRRRLARDRPDLYRKVMSGEIRSVYAAAEEAGIVKRPVRIRTDDPQKVAAALRRHMTPEHLAELRRLLGEDTRDDG